MITEVKIENYKSILSETIPLGRINVFIGENGCGKTNILEAIAFFCASKDNDLSADGLFNRGIRVTKPSLTFSSFLNNKTKNEIGISLKVKNNEIEEVLKSNLFCKDPGNIFSEWNDLEAQELRKLIIEKVTNLDSKSIESLIKNVYLKNNEQIEFDINDFSVLIEKLYPKLNSIIQETIYSKEIRNFLIYNVSSNALRGITSLSKRFPLGINGEGLDVLLANLSTDEFNYLNSLNFITWLKKIHLDKKDELKLKGHKLGRSSSDLYFVDKFMQRNNNIFAAENANEGALFILFYLSLFISKQTPSFFAIDNIETALNPRLCRDLIKNIAQLSKENSKQVLITTHNPAVLDGMNLLDEDQKLFIVKRSDEGHTKVEQIKLKPNVDNQKLKLSEMWMRGFLGGLSTYNF